MMKKKLTVSELKEIFPDNELRSLFLLQEHIARLSSEEQEKQWQAQLEGINSFMDLLTGVESYLV